MRRVARAALVALAGTVGGSPALAGGLADCAVTGNCPAAAGDARIIVSTPAPGVAGYGIRDRRARVVCPYPHRPSDSVFSGGAGYVIKDDVRARLGCR